MYKEGSNPLPEHGLVRLPQILGDKKKGIPPTSPSQKALGGPASSLAGSHSPSSCPNVAHVGELKTSVR